MNIVREELGTNTAIIRLEVSKADYQGQVQKSLDKYKKQARIPGFRPGKVPTALIQKQFGKSILAEELNKMVNDALYNYLKEQELDILGNPIPANEKEVEGDFDQPNDFVFHFEIGLKPNFEVKLEKEKFDYITVKVDGELVNKQLDDIRRRYGKLTPQEEIGENDLVMVKFTELNDDKSEKEGGVAHSSTVSMEFLENKKAKKALTGKKIGDVLEMDPADLAKDEKDLLALVGIKSEQAEGLSKLFSVAVTEIRRMELAELNQELFDKLFPSGEITDEASLRSKIAEDLKNMFGGDADRLLTRKVYDHLIETTKMELPSDFLKRWIHLSNEKPIPMEEIEAQFEQYEKGMKWQLIQGDLFKTHQLQAEYGEVLEFTKGLLVSNYAQYGIPAPDDQELTSSAVRVLSNKDEANRVYDMLAETKLTQLFKEKVQLNTKEVAYDDFVKMASEN